MTLSVLINELHWPTITFSGLVTAGFSGVIWWLKTHSEKKITAKIEHEFNQKLESYKSDLQKDVESYKSKIQTEFEVFKLTTAQAQDRRTRSNEKEYSACIECWNSLYEAFLTVNRIVSDFRILPKLNGLEKNVFDLAIEGYELLDIEKMSVFSSSDRDKEFYKTLRYKDLNLAKTSINKAKKNLSEKGIFIEEDLYNSLEQFLNFLSMVWAENYTIFTSGMAPRTSFNIQFLDSGPQRVKSIRDIFRKNLYIRALSFANETDSNVTEKLSL